MRTMDSLLKHVRNTADKMWDLRVATVCCLDDVKQRHDKVRFKDPEAAANLETDIDALKVLESVVSKALASLKFGEDTLHDVCVPPLLAAGDFTVGSAPAQGTFQDESHNHEDHDTDQK